MKQKWLFAGAVLFLAAGLGGYVAVKELNRPRFDAAKLNEVRRGMTLQEVSGLVGGPPGHYRRMWGDDPGGHFLSLTIYPDAVRHEEWSDNDGYYFVYFDKAGGAVRIEDRFCDGWQRRVNRGEKTHTRVLDRVSSD
jgi:hypothetical protein